METRLALINGSLILPEVVIQGKAIVIQNDTILDIVSRESLEIGIPTFDVGGRYIAPGFIDIHVHGAFGHTFNEPDPEAFAIITEANVRYGVTSMLATIATASISDLVNCLQCCREWINDSSARSGAHIVGVHLEGPYFNLAQRGAQDPQHIRMPDDGTLETLLGYHDVIKIMSFAPELPGATALTERLHSLGIVPAAGHSSAKDTDVATTMALGLRHIIHIWSGQSSTVREGPWRKPGLLEASLTFDGLTVEMIADNKHLPPTLMRLAYKCVGPERLCIISDATSGAGLPDGAPFRMGDVEYVVHDGVGMTLDGTSFAGSTTLLGQMLPILVNVLGIPLHEAVRMMALTPAQVIGIDGIKGSLDIGKAADLVILDQLTLSTWQTMVAGKWSYINQQD